MKSTSYNRQKKLLEEKRGVKPSTPVDPVAERDAAFKDSGLEESFHDQWNAIYDAYDPSSISDTFWDNVANFFGARSSADKQRLSLENRRKEELANLVGVGREQRYNSESESASRMRAAGQNPDLLGIDSAADATESTELDPVDFSGLSSGKDVLESASNAFSTALSLFSGVQSLKLTGLDIASKQISQLNQSEDDTFNLLRTLMSKEGYLNYLDPNSDHYDPNSKVLDRSLRNLGLRSRRARKMFITRANSLVGSYAADIKHYGSLSDFMKAQEDYSSHAAAWYRDNGVNSTDHSITKALKTYNDVLQEVNAKSASFQRTYLTLLRAGDRAKAENAANDFAAFSARKKKELYRRLTSSDDMFSLILATQLMGDTPSMASGVSSLAKLFL